MIWENRRSGFVGDQEVIAVLFEGIGDRVVCVLRGDHYIFVKFDDFAIAKDAKFTKAA